MLIKDLFQADLRAQCPGVFKKEKLNEWVSLKCVVLSNYIKTVLHKIFMYDINWTFLVA